MALLLAGTACQTAWAQDAAPPADPPTELPPTELPPPAEVDPDEPLAPLPELGIPWPEVSDEEGDPVFEPLAEELSEEEEEQLADAELIDSDIRQYEYELVGIPADVETEVDFDFDVLSALSTGGGEADNAAQIDRRAKTDIILLDSILESVGYYAAVIDLDYVPRGEELLVRFLVEPGERFTFTEVQLPGIAATGENEAALRQAFNIEEGEPVVAAEVIGGTAALSAELGERGYANAELGERQVILDYDTATATLVQPIDAGPVARYGELRVEGQPPFPARHVQRIARFEPGEIYARSEVIDLRQALIQTGLVSSVVVDTESNEAADVVDVVVRLQPAKPRTIAAEVGYGTGEGFRVEGEWQHRNFWNPEGALTLNAILGTREQLLGATMVRSNWLKRDQRLTMQALASNLNRNAYDARTVSLSGRIERVSDLLWQKEFTYGIGAEILATDELTIEEDLGLERRRTYFIGAIPATATIDQSNDLLDPTEGYTVTALVSPEISLQGQTDSYLKSHLVGTYYRPFGERIVLAGRAKVATIYGAEREDIAPSRRLYGGGGGSVRGYGFQQLGPRDQFGEPIGGRSQTEFNLEARVRVYGQIAVVPFFDGGRVSEDPWPGESDWQFGAGLGLRYHSNFGPIRLDVGFPLNPREGDPPVAVVVGLGQAF